VISLWTGEIFRGKKGVSTKGKKGTGTVGRFGERQRGIFYFAGKKLALRGQSKIPVLRGGSAG
jgi:hypothetical protein